MLAGSGIRRPGPIAGIEERQNLPKESPRHHFNKFDDLAPGKLPGILGHAPQAIQQHGLRRSHWLSHAILSIADVGASCQILYVSKEIFMEVGAPASQGSVLAAT